MGARSGAKSGCGSHTTAETALRCGRCDTLVCGKCMVPTEVGTRCRSCSPAQARRTVASDSGTFLPGNASYYVLGVVAVAAIAALAYGLIYGHYNHVIIATIVISGSLCSTVLHEFFHGYVAYLGGDRSIRQRGMLTLNPLKYIDPVFSIIMPLIMVARGGLPLVGGRTLIHHDSLRSKEWQSAVSLAGPATNFAIACILSLLLNLGVFDGHFAVRAGFGYLANLQIAFCIFNLLPIPPFDGYGIIRPFLSYETQAKIAPFGMMGYIAVFIAFSAFPGFSDLFWEQVYELTWLIRVPTDAVFVGWYYTQLR